MRRLILALVSGLAVIPALARAAPAETKRAQVLVLGTYHMANPGHDVFNMQADDVLSARRQQEIAELIAALERFRPTKIAVEADYGSDVVPKRYAEYLAGTHTLTRNEIEQIGFRLAKEMGHAAIYPVDEDDDFPLQRVTDYAKATGQSAQYEATMGGWGTMVKALEEHLESHTVLQSLVFVNSDARVAEDIGLYYQLARYGERGDFAGPDLLAEWYRRNVRIYSHIMGLIDSPDERIVVVFGYGHLGWLQHDVAANPTLRLRKLEEFVPAAAKGAASH
jgi:uncharacterized protein DUF5694